MNRATKLALAAGAIMFLLTGSAVAAEADSGADEDPNWVVDRSAGCAAFDQNPNWSHSIEWHGGCQNGQAEGQGTLIFYDQGRFLEKIAGNFASGAVTDGQVSIAWADGTTYQGQMTDNAFSGHGVLVTANGDRYEGEWQNNKLNGHGIAAWKNGDRYEGEWRDSKSDGVGTQVWANGQKYAGLWANDLPNGHGVLTRTDGSRVEGEFVDGNPRPVPHATEHTETVPATTSADSAVVSPAKLGDVGALAGMKFIAVDGSTLSFRSSEEGFRRELARSDGTSQTMIFSFVGEKLGTVADDDGPGNVIGMFRASPAGIDIDYADGRTESIAFASGGTLSATYKPQGPAGSYHVSWYPEGHVFTADERRAALADYAAQLGAPSMPAAADDIGSSAPARTVSAMRTPKTARAKSAGKTKKASAQTALAPPKAAQADAVPPAFEPVVVKTSTVHLIDDPAPPAQRSASDCLTIESNGAHWGFRNRCGYDVQFAYCLMHAPGSLAECGSGTASGSVAAKGFGALMADESLKEKDGEHDFRWIACNGGAGEVMAKLERFSPPAGRCIHAGERQVASGDDGAN